MEAIIATISRSSARLGGYISKRPVLVLVVTLVLSIASCIGFARFRMETSSDSLWVPQRGKSRDDKNFVEANFKKARQGASFYAQLKPEWYSTYGGDNALQIAVTWEMFQLHNKVIGISVTGDNGTAVTFTDLCYKSSSGTCRQDSYLMFWYLSFPYFLNAVSGSATNPRAGNETAFRNQVSQLEYPNGNSVSLLSVFGGTTFAYNPFKLTSAQVIASDYTLDAAVSDGVAKDWHDKFTDLMKEELPNFTYMTATWITGSTVGEELGASINNDMRLIIISLIVFIVICVLFLSRTDSVKTRTTLALLGVFVTILGIAVGWGWGLIFGMPFTPLQQLSPFILLGMGIDVIFILVKGYDIIVQAEPGLTLGEAFSRLMATSGMSVQVTLMASCVAFALGALDELNSVRWFSAFGTLNTLFILILMSTMFVAMFVLNERRAAANRRDCCCCEPCAKEAPATPAIMVTPVTAVNVPPVQPYMTAGDDGAKAAVQGAHTDGHADENAVKRIFRKYYAPALCKWYVKVLVLAFFTVWAIGCFYGIRKVKYGLPLSDLAPDGSYLQDYDRVSKATYGQQVGDSANLYFRYLDQSKPETHVKMLNTLNMTLGNEFVNASTSAFLGNWLISFLNWADDRNATVSGLGCYNPYVGKVTGYLEGVIVPKQIKGCVPQANFYPLFSTWLASHAGNKNSMVIQNGQLVVSSMPIMHTASMDNDKYESDLYNAVRDLEKQVRGAYWQAEEASSPDYVFLMFNGNYLFYEGTAILPMSTFKYFMLALGGVGFVMLFMLVNPLAALLLVIAVGLTDVYLFGELWALNMRFNDVSVINMIMATGLAVDYSVYFAQRFMTETADGTRNGRMREALSTTGSSVFLGGLTALIGTVPMAFSKSVIIRTFFKMIFGTIAFSLMIGLILMPVLFSLIGPAPVKAVTGAELSVDGREGLEEQQQGKKSASDAMV